MGTSHENHYAFIITSCLFLCTMRNFSDKSCKQSQNTFYVQ